MPGKAYVRRISAEEAREGYVLVLKSRLASFPPVGQAFSMSHGGAKRRVRVEAVPCDCRGPQEPHEHYRIRWPGLPKGTCVSISPDAGGPGAYALDLVS